MQEEEQLQNSMMLNLLYVNRAHDLASHILLHYQVYGQSPAHERCVSPINTNARLENMLMVTPLIMNFSSYLEAHMLVLCCFLAVVG